MIKTLGQERARFAYDKVISAVNNNDDYKPFVKGFSTMIMNNGLGQALAFAKKKNPVFYDHINDWYNNNTCKIKTEKSDILDEIMNIDSQHYRLLTQETLDLVNWFRKFVDSEIE